MALISGKPNTQHRNKYTSNIVIFHSIHNLQYKYKFYTQTFYVFGLLLVLVWCVVECCVQCMCERRVRMSPWLDAGIYTRTHRLFRNQISLLQIKSRASHRTVWYMAHISYAPQMVKDDGFGKICVGSRFNSLHSCAISVILLNVYKYIQTTFLLHRFYYFYGF